MDESGKKWYNGPKAAAEAGLRGSGTKMLPRFQRGEKMKKAAFIGTGNMGSALVRAACRALGAENVAVSNRTPSKAEELARETGCQAFGSNRAAAESAEYVFLCVKPKLIRGVAEELADLLPGRAVVSVAAGVLLNDLQGWVGEDVPVLRIMPNTPCAIGVGMTALSGGKTAREKHFTDVEMILSATGRVERLEEGLIDAFSAVAGCGPAFLYPYIEALADGGVAAGLPRDKALRYAAQTTLGAASMVLETGAHPGKLKDDVCSPGGSTIAGVAELERHGLRAAAIDAVLAAWKKNGQLGK